MSKSDEILLDVLYQACGNATNNSIDNMCMSVYEEACEYLFGKGLIDRLNDRMYKLKNSEDKS